MRKAILLAVGAILVLTTLGATVASAQTSITLGGSSSTVTFSGASSATQVSVTFGTITGSGTGNGALSGGGVAPFSITGGTFTLTDLGSGRWSVSGGGPLTFTWGTLLTGTMTLLSFAQTAGSSTGNFNDLMQVNLTVTGGSLAGAFGTPNGILTFTVAEQGGGTTNISSLLSQSSSNTLVFNFSSGAVNPTPEPSSMLLLGTGLVAVGAFLRRRWLT